MDKYYTYLDIIFLVLIVIFLLFSLLRLFGKKTGYQGNASKPKLSKKFQVLEKVSIPSKNEEKEKPKIILSEGSLDYKLMKIKEKDSNFEIKSFINSAKKAFELIVTNFYKGSLKDIEAFITEDLKNKLSNYVSNNPNSKIVQEIEFLLTDIIDAEINDNNFATIKLKFVTRQKISNEVKEVRENWIFCKNLNQNTTIWLLDKVSTL